MDTEEYCYYMLKKLREGYERDAKPYIDMLTRLRNLETKVSITIPEAEGASWGLPPQGVRGD